MIFVSEAGMTRFVGAGPRAALGPGLVIDHDRRVRRAITGPVDRRAAGGSLRGERASA